MSSATTLAFGSIRTWLAAACCAFMATKIWLVYRLNINWDEFNFLSHVFESTRGDLRLLLQGSFVHAFTWLAKVDGNEIDMILAGRIVMVALLAITAFLLWRLASRWVTTPIALIAATCYLSTLPVLTHGASFRYDSLLAPLLMASILWAASSGESQRNLLTAAIAFGLGVALSIKMLLFVPLLTATILLRTERSPNWAASRSALGLATFAAVAIVTAVTVLFAHSLTLAADAHTAGGFARVSMRTMLLDVPWFPRLDVFERTWQADPVVWVLIAAGAACAAVQPRYRAACTCGLSLLPIVFYRNAWPYFYAVMLAPACVLAAVAIDTMFRSLADKGHARAATLLVLGTGGALLARGAVHVVGLSTDLQSAQRATVEAVHEIFAEPVPYLDHSGMISSFPKANFFMSSWAMERYRAAGIGFMEGAIAQDQPNFLLRNRTPLDLGAAGARMLLERDRELIEKYYLPYWGLVHVAGARIDQTAGESLVDLPFPGRYRLESTQPFIVEGMRRDPGDEFVITSPRVSIASVPVPDAPTSAPAASEPPHARLVIAAAREIRQLSSPRLHRMLSGPIYVLL
jgi:hypothetical protein